MKKYLIDESTLTGLANAIRKVNGSIRTYTPEQMIEAVTTILDSATYILVDENGNEVPAVFVENKTIFDATANDIRIGKVAANQNGVVEGTKEIPTYHTIEGYTLIPAGSRVKLTGFKNYEYTKMQALFCQLNTTPSNSVKTDKVCIDNSVYVVNSDVSISTVTLGAEDSSIDFGVTNDSTKHLILRYFMYKEIY